MKTNGYFIPHCEDDDGYEDKLLVCERCKHKNIENFIKYFEYCEICGNNIKHLMIK